MIQKNEFDEKKYGHYNDYNFKRILENRANGLLRFIGIPYKMRTRILSEYTSINPGISRIDFAGEAEKDGKRICLILECQSKLPNDDDIKRFFQYVTSLRIFKNMDVELFILCTQKAPYDKKEFVLNDDCTYTMHVISLKDFKAEKIFKNIEDKLENNKEITDDDIASLQVIVYTDYDGSEVEVLIKARMLIERIAEKLKMDINEKKAIIELLDVLSVNMINADDINKYEEETYMLLNPTDRYLLNKGKQEGKQEGELDGKMDVAKNMISEGFPIEQIVRLTGLSEKEILNAK